MGREAEQVLVGVAVPEREDATLATGSEERRLKILITIYKQDGDIQSQARIRLSKDELRTDILSDR